LRQKEAEARKVQTRKFNAARRVNVCFGSEAEVASMAQEADMLIRAKWTEAASTIGPTNGNLSRLASEGADWAVRVPGVMAHPLVFRKASKLISISSVSAYSARDDGLALRPCHSEQSFCVREKSIAPTGYDSDHHHHNEHCIGDILAGQVPLHSRWCLGINSGHSRYRAPHNARRSHRMIKF
jgi:hypothetical protein